MAQEIELPPNSCNLTPKEGCLSKALMDITRLHGNIKASHPWSNVAIA